MLQMNAPFLSTKLNVYIHLDNREGARVIYIYKKENQYRWKKTLKFFTRSEKMRNASDHQGENEGL